MDKKGWLQRCQWLQSPLGKMLIEAEQFELSHILPKTHLGRFALVYHSTPLFTHLLTPRVKQTLCLSVALEKAAPQEPLALLCDGENIPLQENSMSLVILPHVLPLADSPQHTVSAAVKCLAGQGLVVITGFNPYSLWGLCRIISNRNAAIRSENRLISPWRIRRWLREADCTLIKTRTVFFRLPSSRTRLARVGRFLEALGRLCWPTFGSAYVIVAQKQSVPLTPEAESWRLRNVLFKQRQVLPTPRSFYR